jgi:BirA family transcriptional regulator, biotin operon repressor / biotin---[acetyl-CoA-carboxylase] ligase
MTGQPPQGPLADQAPGADREPGADQGDPGADREPGAIPGRPLGRPRLHLRRTTSTNERARALAAAGAPHGALVTAAEQTAGRGRQGRTWTAPAGSSLLCSVLIRDPPLLLPLAAGVAVADAVDAAAAVADAASVTSAAASAAAVDAAAQPAAIKWPNDILVDGRKVAGILVEGRPQEHWAVVGIGLNVAVNEADFPPELAGRAGTLGLGADLIEPMLQTLLARLEHWIGADAEAVLAAVRARDALLGRRVRWAGGEGRGDGVDGDGRLVVLTPDGGRVTLDAGEVHLLRD